MNLIKFTPPPNFSPTKILKKFFCVYNKNSHLILSVCGKKICSIRRAEKNKSSDGLLKSIYNNSLLPLNNETLSHLGSKTGRRILYVTQNLQAIGGVETRLAKQLNFFNPNILQGALLTEKNSFYPLLKFPNFHLDFYAPNFLEHLIHIVHTGHFDFVEFQCHNLNYLKDIHLDLLKRYCKVGIAFHNKVADNYQYFINQADYCLRVSPFILPDVYISNGETIPFIRNWVECIHPIWQYAKQKKALYIARLDNDKLPTLKNFVKICEILGYDYEIAGRLPPNTLTANFMAELPTNSYIGPIDTVDFLSKHAANYLFVGGVGQVVLEALSFNIPALVLTHFDDYTLSRFVIQNQFLWFYQRNCVIKLDIPDFEEGNIEQFIEDVKNENFIEYNNIDNLRAHCSEECTLNKYLSLLNVAYDK